MSELSPPGRKGSQSFLQVFKLRDFSLLWVILVTTGVASWLRILGVAQWLLDNTNSAWLVGAIGLVQVIVQTPGLLWAGALADRVDRKKLILFSHAISFGVLMLLALLEANGQLSAAVVYVAIAVTALTLVFASPARSALIPIIVPERLLLPAASIDTASMNAGAIIGPLIFAAVATSLGLEAVFLLGAGLFLLAALVSLAVRAAGRAMAEGGTELEEGMWRRTRNGITYVKRHPILPGLFLLDIGITVVSFYRDILPVLALGLFAGGAAASGLLGAANSTGAIIGSLVAIVFMGFRAKGMLVIYASLSYGLFLFGFGLSTSLWIGLFMIALVGAADAVTVAVRNTTVMLTTPDEMRGRAFSLMYLAASGANNLGTVWVGFCAGLIGAQNTMLLGAVLAILATVLIAMLWRQIRTFRSDEG